MILFLTGALLCALLSVFFGTAGALLVAFVAGVALLACCVGDFIALREPYKVEGIPTGRVVLQGWRRR